MRKIYFISALFSFMFCIGFSQPGNDLCSNATTLTPNAAPICAQTTDGGGTSIAETITAATVGAANNFSQTVWYKFTATSTSMFIEWEFTGLVSGATWCPGNMSMVIYNASTCTPSSATIMATESAAADGAILIEMTTLVVGNTYMIQVGYNTGAGCKPPIFCMAVGNTPAVCTCGSPCAAGCGYATTPSVATVTSTCPEYDLNPLSDGNDNETYCYTFTANSTNVSFSMIITSNCSGGNVGALTWTLQTTSCGANVASGTLANMSATTVVGTNYVLCYNYTIPSTCHHSSVYPYFVGAVPLPVELISFYGEIYQKNSVKLEWSTATENENEYFILEKSKDGENFEALTRIQGAGTSNHRIDYSFVDDSPYFGNTYYRLVQVDRNGNSSTSGIATVVREKPENFDFSIYPNPSNDGNMIINLAGKKDEIVTVNVLDITGKNIINRQITIGSESNDQYSLNLNLIDGLYIIQILDKNQNIKTNKFIVTSK